MVNIHREIEVYNWLKAKLLNEHPDLKDDQETLDDTLEGCTNFKEAVDRLVDVIAHDTELVTGCAARLKFLSARKKRLEDRIERNRLLILEAMQKVEKRNLEHPEYTLTRGSKPRGVILTNERLLPADYVVPQPSKPDMMKIKHDLLLDMEVPGAVLDNGGETLTMRRN